jgi:hypothetical protein
MVNRVFVRGIYCTGARLSVLGSVAPSGKLRCSAQTSIDGGSLLLRLSPLLVRLRVNTAQRKQWNQIWRCGRFPDSLSVKFKSF